MKTEIKHRNNRIFETQQDIHLGHLGVKEAYDCQISPLHDALIEIEK
jgi:hypothetical protein